MIQVPMTAEELQLASYALLELRSKRYEQALERQDPQARQDGDACQALATRLYAAIPK